MGRPGIGHSRSRLRTALSSGRTSTSPASRCRTSRRTSASSRPRKRRLAVWCTRHRCMDRSRCTPHCRRRSCIGRRSAGRYIGLWRTDPPGNMRAVSSSRGKRSGEALGKRCCRLLRRPTGLLSRGCQRHRVPDLDRSRRRESRRTRQRWRSRGERAEGRGSRRSAARRSRRERIVPSCARIANSADDDTRRQANAASAMRKFRKNLGPMVAHRQKPRTMVGHAL
jgi:hypothetical protein